MQEVSQAWLDNQNQTIVSESYVEVSIDIADPDAIVDASSAANGEEYISDATTLVNNLDKHVVPYATLEQNLWLLDGSRRMIPETDPYEDGYVGNVFCDSDGYFTDLIPLITITFTKVHQNLVPGITITWDTVLGNEFASDFIVTAYNGSYVVAETTITNNETAKTIVEMDIIDYDRITISVLRWSLPEHRARIQEIFLGINKVYGKNSLFSYSHTQTADPISSVLPKAEISFSIDNRDNVYNPNNPNSLTKYLMERQEVRSRYGYKLGNGVEWIDGGKFHLSEWDAEQNGISASFKARDLLEYMSSTYYEGVYEPNGISLYDLAVRILVKADLPLNSDGTLKWHVDESLKDIYTTAPLPIDTLANCLQLIANAAGCALYQDRHGVLRVEPANIDTDINDISIVFDESGGAELSGTDMQVSETGEAIVSAFVNIDSSENGELEPLNLYKITLQNSYSKSEIELSKPLKQVNVETFSYFAGDSVELYKGVLQLSGTTEMMLVYSEKAVQPSISVTGGTVSSVTYYTGACELTVVATGEVEIIVSGTALKESKTDVITPSGRDGETITVSNPLITNRARAAAIGALAESILKNRRSLKSSWRADPRLDVLDIVRNVNEYGENHVLMTNVNYQYNGAFRGSGEGRTV